MTYIMSCVWLDYMVKYFQCKNCVGSSLKTKKCVASFLVPGDMQGALIGFQCPLKALCFFIPKQMLYFKMNLMINLLENFQKCL